MSWGHQQQLGHGWWGLEGRGEPDLAFLCQFSVPDFLSETAVAFLFQVRSSGWGQNKLP